MLEKERERQGPQTEIQNGNKAHQDANSETITKTEYNEPVALKGIDFIRRNKLIYHIGLEGKERLCVSEKYEKEIFCLVHDERAHAGFHQAYKNAAESIYIC